MDTSGDRVKIRAFGTLEIYRDGSWKRIAARQERALLACLLLEANRIEPTGKLIAELWPRVVPIHPQKAIGTLVSRLRHLLDGTGMTIENHGGGYRILAGQDELDLQVFEAGCTAGLRAFENGKMDETIALIEHALSFWRGTPFSDTSRLRCIDATVDYLHEVRLNALEIKAQAGLTETVRLGDHKAVGSLVVELRSLLAQSPLRERSWCMLMQALYLAGRPAESIQVYADCRAKLQEELGVAPGPELRALYQEMLTGTFDADQLAPACTARRR